MIEKENTIVLGAEPTELDDITKAEVIKAIESSLRGEQITDQQASLVFYWSRHQDSAMFNFVPKKYKLNIANKKPKRRKAITRK